MSQKKPNPWGEESYSDLIARALSSAPEGRLKLNEIYQWFSENVPYFRDRSSQEDAQGWKVYTQLSNSYESKTKRDKTETNICFRTQSAITCLCIVDSCVSKMKGLERALGGSSTRMQSLAEIRVEEPLPWKPQIR